MVPKIWRSTNALTTNQYCKATRLLFFSTVILNRWNLTTTKYHLYNQHNYLSKPYQPDYLVLEVLFHGGCYLKDYFVVY